MNSPIKLSVLMVTYNHEEFIRQAIDSVLFQQVDFAYEIVIGDDVSTDLTRKILLEYQNNHPDNIKLIFRDKNLGCQENLLDVVKACKGEYVALLDGDDYWTSPLKLAKVVKFLDENAECPMCFHQILKSADDQKQLNRKLGPKKEKSFLSTEDLLKKGGAVTSSTVWRRDILDYAATVTRHLEVDDRARAIVATEFGDIGYIDEVMGVWRIHNNNSFHCSAQMSRDNYQIKISNAFIQLFEEFDSRYEYKYHELIAPSLTLYHYRLSEVYIRRLEWESFACHLLKALFVPIDREKRTLNKQVFISIMTIFKSAFRRNKMYVLRKVHQIKTHLERFMGFRTRRPSFMSSDSTLTTSGSVELSILDRRDPPLVLTSSAKSSAQRSQNL